MKILVIDDQPYNRASAKLLENDGHEVTIVGTIKDAFQYLPYPHRTTSFDLVMTDLFMPIEGYRRTLRSDIELPSGAIPVGLIFAIASSNAGLPTIIVTDKNHHTDVICTLLKLIESQRMDVSVRSGKICVQRADSSPLLHPWDEDAQKINTAAKRPMNYKGPLIKDWALALSRTRFSHHRTYERP